MWGSGCLFIPLINGGVLSEGTFATERRTGGYFFRAGAFVQRGGNCGGDMRGHSFQVYDAHTHTRRDYDAFREKKETQGGERFVARKGGPCE